MRKPVRHSTSPRKRTAGVHRLARLLALVAMLLNQPLAAVHAVTDEAHLAHGVAHLSHVAGTPHDDPGHRHEVPPHLDDHHLILLAKLGLLAGLLGLALVNKLRLTPALASGDPGAGWALRRTIEAELALAAGILVATAALGTTPPPRVLQNGAETHAGHIHARPASRGLSVTIIVAGRSAEIRLDSDRSGANGARIELLDSAGRPLQAQEVTLVAANPAAGVEPIRRTAEAAGPGIWKVEQILMVPAGSWSIRIDALIGDFERTSLETVITLR